MRLLNTALALALTLVSAIPATAAPMPRAGRGEHVSIDEMSVYPCVKGCLWSNLWAYPLESKTRQEFCVTDVFHANLWLNKKVQPCMAEKCPREDWDAIGQESRDWLQSFCGYGGGPPKKFFAGLNATVAEA
ncbi:hypothetical protein E8E12_005020 [Didymella heteroderae]|uniref:Secreted protein n=1 Tax=Didymella heteroderae TaxID=1769908 RepID=A0A9P4WTH2_9PLEO|nr:hypothetical protein E8E12_005020 [Didymella heteroderae]